ncbi:MAG: T9SS type A sorting domain-containing protein, partial [Candidatus Cloacimonadales bacterium]|nr:T9SS type A sorting domain-containing protein [Candidatus Cloacimonadales bacterium]
ALSHCETTDDGENWHSVWSHTGQTINPHIENITINSPDVGSSSFQFAFVLDGQPGSVIAWVVDEIQLSEILVVPHGYVAGNVTLIGGNGSVENVIISATGISKTPDENGFYLLPVPEGIYDVSASLPGYITETGTNVSVTNWQTTTLDFNLNVISVNNPPENLVAESSYNDVTLTWDMPGTDRMEKSRNESVGRERAFLGYNIYRNNNMIDQISDILITEYSDEALNAGDYTYYVTALFDEGESDPSNSETVTITLAPPQDLVYQITGPGMVLLQWDAPAPAARGFNNYRVYRNSELLADNVVQTFYFNINVPVGIYTYGVSCVYDGYESEPATVEVEVTEVINNVVPLVTELTGNYPNPFNPTTTISFELNTETTENTEIVFFNMKGQKIKQLVNEQLSAGKYSVVWDGKDDQNKPVSSGIYFYRMITKDYSATKKMIMLK